MNGPYEIIRRRLWRDFRFTGLTPEAQILYLRLRTGPPVVCRGLAHAQGHSGDPLDELASSGLLRRLEHDFVLIPDAYADDVPHNADHLKKLVEAVCEPGIPEPVRQAWLEMAASTHPDRWAQFLDRHATVSSTVGDTVQYTMGGTGTVSVSVSVSEEEKSANAGASATNFLSLVEQKKAEIERKRVEAIVEWQAQLERDLSESRPETREWVLGCLLPEALSMIDEYHSSGRRKGWSDIAKADFARSMKRQDSFAQVVGLEVFVDRGELVSWNYVARGIVNGIAEDERNGVRTVEKRLAQHRKYHPKGLYAQWLAAKRQERSGS